MDELIPVGHGDDEEGVEGGGPDDEDAGTNAGTKGRSRAKAPALA